MTDITSFEKFVYFNLNRNKNILSQISWDEGKKGNYGNK